MLGKRARPMKLTQPSVSGGRFGFTEAIPSPKCSLEYRILSPRTSLKNSDPVCGIGLGILAALEKSSGENTQPMKVKLGGSSTARSNPIPINGTAKAQEIDISCTESESYTRVTSRRPDKAFNKVYYDNGEIAGAGHDRSGYDDMSWTMNSSVFCVSPPRVEVSTAFPMLDFLSYCHLCRKQLHGRDIYIYRGEKAFCSPECRCRQIAMDERKEKCGTEVSRSLDVSNSSYSRENIFFTGVIAA